MEIVKPTFGRIILLWWSIIWRCVALGLAGALVAGVVLGVALGLAGASKELMTVVGQIAGAGIGTLACLYVGWSRVGKGVGDFELVLVKRRSGAGGVEA